MEKFRWTELVQKIYYRFLSSSFSNTAVTVLGLAAYWLSALFID